MGLTETASGTMTEDRSTRASVSCPAPWKIVPSTATALGTESVST